MAFSYDGYTLLSANRGQSKLLTQLAYFSNLLVVPRKLRVQYPGAIYHIMNRGDRRDAIFADDDDRTRFLETLGQTCEKTSWRLQALCTIFDYFSLRLVR